MAYRWHTKNGVNKKFTDRFDSIWSDTYECGARLAPGFVRKNLPQPQWKPSPDSNPPPIDKNAKLVCRYSQMVLPNQPERTMDELLALRWKTRQPSHQRLFDYEPEVEDTWYMDESDSAMEETFIGQRRVSIHPLKLVRDSLLPRKSMAPASDRRTVYPSPRLSELPEEETPDAAGAPVFSKPAGEHQFAEPFAVPKKIAKPRDSLAMYYAKKQITPTVEEDYKSPVVEQIMKRRVDEEGQEISSSKNRCMSKYP